MIVPLIAKEIIKILLLVGICFKQLVLHIKLIKLKKLIIKYINAQIKLIYNGTEKETIVGNITLPISEDGILKAIISCGGETPKFEVDDETGQLLQANVRNSNYDEVYALGEDDYSNK